MRAFQGLFIKELKLTKNLFLFSLLAMFVIVLLGIGLERYFHAPEIITVITITVFFMHVFFMPTYLFISLKTEAQTQLWLHNPNSGRKLFLAKLAACVFYFLISITMAFILAKWGISYTVLNGDIADLPISLTQTLPYLLLSGLVIFFMSLFMGNWVLFFWSFYHALKNIPIIKNLRWLIIIGTWFIITFVENYISNLPMFQKIKRMGTIKIDSIPLIRIEAGGNYFTAGVNNTVELSIMNGVIYLSVIVTVFTIAVWLLERKVEV